MNQGEIWLINLGPVAYSETGLTRPGLILSINAMNQNAPRLIIAPITSKVGKVYPFEVFLSSGTGGLDRDSKIMLDQIRSIDKKRLIRKIGTVEKDLLIQSSTIACKLITAI
jgi:mRNA interferase MazF